MNEALFTRLAAIPKLGVESVHTTSCKVCRGHARFFDVVDFNKFCSQADFYSFGGSDVTVTYFMCIVCQFIFTEFFDSWSPEDFSQFVYNEDYIKVDGDYAGSRPERDATALAKLLDGLTNVRILDYGSGSGLLAGHLRSRGFTHATSYDPFSSPSRPDGRFDVVTCFEVLEHTTNPRATLTDVASLLDPGGCVIFSTGIQPPNIAVLRASWWYIAPRNGHASIYTLKALALTGQAAGLTLYAGSGGNAFAGIAASPASQRLLSSIGRPCYFFRLTAPNGGAAVSDQQKTSWHGAEGNGAASYRWTREADVFWWLQAEPLQPCDLTITIPFRMEVQLGFADGCRLMIGGRFVKLSREAGELKASLSLNESVEPVIRLITPPLLRPCDLRPVPDRRLLGLAIATE